MRVNFISFNLAEPDLYYRYSDLIESGSAITGPEDLEDDYYDWIKEKDFAWYVEKDDDGYFIFTVAFYEEHPFFNCLLLRKEYIYDRFTYNQSFMPFKVVEPWLMRVFKNYNRRQRRKAIKGEV